MEPPQKPLLNEVLQAHHQFAGDFCAVSGLEFVSKLYGLTQLSKFPLQENQKNESKGFGEQSLQALVYLEGEDAHGDAQSVMGLIEKETNQGMSVLVSLRGFVTFGRILNPIGYHIFVATSQGDQPILVDPQTKQIQAPSRADLANILQWNSQQNPERKTIHIQALHPKK